MKLAANSQAALERAIVRLQKPGEFIHLDAMGHVQFASGAKLSRRIFQLLVRRVAFEIQHDLLGKPMQFIFAGMLDKPRRHRSPR